MDTYKNETMDELLYCWENKNKDKHNNNCHEKRKHFSQFFLSVDGIIGENALVLLTNLSQLIEKKLKEPLSQVRGWVNGRISIVIATL